MDRSDHRIKQEQRNYEDKRRMNGDYHPLRSPSQTHVATDRMEGIQIPGYTLMVAGRRTGKTSFLRLLLDTSIISPLASREQLDSVAKFVYGSSGHTTHIRSMSVIIELVNPDSDQREPLMLTLIDTPSLETQDDASSRTVSEIMRHVEARFSESVEDEYKARTGDHHVHLCIYFLDPDDVVPLPVSPPPVPVVPRARTNSLSKPEQEPVILEPPLSNNPRQYHPTLPLADINVIRRLSARVNVLPVVARADVLTNDRLATVKIAIRNDLANAGIGFGIFDVSSITQYSPQDLKPSKPHLDNGYSTHANGSSSSATSPPTTPISPSLPKLPYALISPDIYSHSDGISRPAPSHFDLVKRYSPSHSNSSKNYPASRTFPGKFTRNYRWGSLDIMDGTHCDFVHIRGAIFHHMETLQKYTREYLLEKFRAEYQVQHPLPTHALGPRGQPPSTSMPRLPPLSHGSRPILAIDTAPPSHMANRHPSIPVSRSLNNGEVMPHSAVQGQGHPGGLPDLSPKAATSSRSRQRTKKITVACNFCRSRKLKCDGGRPACGQCFKRSNPCDYMVNSKRRGNHRRRKRFEDGSIDGMGGSGGADGGGYGSGGESDGDGGDSGGVSPLGEMDEPSLSPEIRSKSSSRRNSRADVTLPPLNSTIERRERDDGMIPVLPPINQASSSSSKNHNVREYGSNSAAVSSNPGNHRNEGGMNGAGREERLAGYGGGSGANTMSNHELPPIATLPVPLSSSSGQDLMQTLPPLRGAPPNTAADQQSGTTRRRASSASTKGTRASTFGSKIVACNFCRARKTRCDGAHPACGSCARRSLACNYVNDPSNGNPKGRPKIVLGSGSATPSASALTSTTSPQGLSAPSSRRGSPILPSAGSAVPQVTGTANGYIRGTDGIEGDIDLKRNLDIEMDGHGGRLAPSSKKMRITDGSTTSASA